MKSGSRLLGQEKNDQKSQIEATDISKDNKKYLISTLEKEKEEKDKIFKNLRTSFSFALRRKSDIRMIVFLFHYYGLHLKTTINIETIFNEDDDYNYFELKKIISNDLQEIVKINTKIRIFDYFELPIEPNNRFREAIVELLVFIADKSYPLFSPEHGYLKYWCERVFWCTEGIRFEFTTPQTIDLEYVKIELLKQQISYFKECCIPEIEFQWIKTKRSANFILMFIQQYIKKSNQNSRNTDYINKKINYILNSMNSIKSIEHAIIHTKTIIDILPIDIEKKRYFLQEAKDKWMKTPSILPISSWLNKNEKIYDWIYKYISETIFNSKIPTWAISIHNWNQLKSLIETKHEVRSILYTLNDISALNIYNFSFKKLKKSAQKHIERSSILNVKVSIGNLKLLDEISTIMNIPHNKLLTDILKNELSKIKPSKIRIQKNERKY